MQTQSSSLVFFQPHPRLAQDVQSYWKLDCVTTGLSELRYFHPDGGSGIILQYGDEILVDGAVRKAGVFAGARLLKAAKMEIHGRLTMIGVRFRPGHAFPFFGTSRLDDAWHPAWSSLYHSVGSAASFQDCAALLDAWLLARKGAAHLSAATSTALDLIAARAGGLRIEDLSEECGVSPRHLERLFEDQVGYSPKQLARIVRIRRGKRELSYPRLSPVSQVAYSLGFSDQAHFTREFHSLIGLSPADFQSRIRASRVV